MIIGKRNLHGKNTHLSYLAAEKLHFPLNVSDRWTDVSSYRVASLLKIKIIIRLKRILSLSRIKTVI